MNNKKELIWEFYISPLGENIKDVELEGPEDILKEILHGPPPDKYDDDDDDDDDEPHHSLTKAGMIKVLQTPFGLVPLMDANNPSKYFQFWIGHTTFDITEEVVKTIENSPGVEILEIFSRYRFRICIGKAFKAGEVLGHIRKTLCGNDLGTTDGKIEALKEKLGQYKYWAIFVLPDGKISSCYANQEDYSKFNNILQQYTRIKDAVGGELYTYVDRQ